MYKVLLADDDYPVLELLSEAVDWKALGFQLCAACENGAEAWDYAQKEMPDVLITDIGMPKMDGLELTGRLKAIKPSVRVAILSCHMEFQYARQAMKLNVQEYIVKDTFEPEDLRKLLLQFRESLDNEKNTNWEQTRIRQLIEETQQLRKENFFRQLLEQPMLSEEQWREEAASYGLLKGGEVCYPIMGCIEDYQTVKTRFYSEQSLHFAIGNVIEELLRLSEQKAVFAGYNARQFFVLMPCPSGLKYSPQEAAKHLLTGLQSEIYRVLRIRTGFLLGSGAASAPNGLKSKMKELLEAALQRFYLSEAEIAYLRNPSVSKEELFDSYNQACSEIWEAVIHRDSAVIQESVQKWMNWIRFKQFPGNRVKDWTLKLLLDLQLKLHMVNVVSPDTSAEVLHKQVADLDSLRELEQWLVLHLKSFAAPGESLGGVRCRPEVVEACRYVSMHLERRISLEEVADEFHLNPSYFSRLFKKETGLTFIEYVTRQKMERAKELLEQTSRTVGEVCEELGYDNQSYFIKTFKAFCGMTPLEYRTGGLRTGCQMAAKG